MNTNQHITNQAELEQLISRYFDGETTVKEEQMLREVLADCPWSSEAIDEARFTMGYYTAHKQQGHRTFLFGNRYRIAAIAASIAIVLAVGIGVFWHNHPQYDNMCVACVNGKMIENEDAVMSLIANDLNSMEDASQSMEAQLLSIGEALELDNN